MANTESKKLAVDVIARVDKLEKAMAKAAKATDTSMSRVTRRAQRAARDVDTAMARAATSIQKHLSGAFVTFGATIVGGGVLGAIGKLRSEFSGLGKTADVADRLGVDIERLQEFRHAAEMAGMETNNFDMALRRFIRRASEAAQGTGAAKDAFKELGISLVDGSGRLKQSDVLLKEVADKLRGVGSQADRLRLAFKFFDTGGAEMINVLAGGSQGVENMAAEARRLGVVIDRDMVRKAQEVDVEFNKIAKSISGNVTTGVVSTALAVRQLHTNTEGWLNALGNSDVFKKFNEFFNLLNEETAKKHGITLLSDTNRRIAQGHADAAGSIKPLVPQNAPYTPENSKLKELKATYDDLVKVADARIARMDTERQAVGMSTAAAAALRLETDLLNRANQLGIELSPKQVAALREKAAAYGKIAAATEDAREAQQRLEELKRTAESTMSGFARDLMAGKSAGEALKKVLDDISGMLIDMAVKGLVKQALGGVLGGGAGGGGGGPLNLLSFLKFDDGGYTGPGGKYQPKGVVHAGEVVWSQKDVARAGGVATVEAMRLGRRGYAGGGPALPQYAPPTLPRMTGPAGGITVNGGTTSIVVQGNADDRTLTAMKQELARRDAEFEARTIAAVRKASAGRMLR